MILSILSKKKKLILYIFVAVFLVYCYHVGAAPGDPPEEPPAQTNGTLKGVVRGAADLMGIQGAKITVDGVNKGVTDINGEFTISNIPDGGHQFNVIPANSDYNQPEQPVEIDIIGNSTVYYTFTLGENVTGIFDRLALWGKYLLSIPDRITDAINNTIASVLNGMKKTLLQETFGILMVFEKLLTDTGIDFTKGVVARIAGVLRPFAVSFACLWFVIMLTKKSVYLDALNPQETFKGLMLLVLSSSFITNSLKILQYVLEANAQIVQKIIDIGVDWNQVVRVMDAQLSPAGGDALTLDAIAFLLFFLIMVIFNFLMMCGMYITLILRQVELQIMAAVSPLFFSCIAGEQSMEIFKSYIKNFMAIVLTTVYISAGMIIFSELMTKTITNGIGAYIEALMKCIAMSFYVIKAPAALRSILGTGSSSINVTSVVRAFM